MVITSPNLFPKTMNPFTALKNLSQFHFTFLFFFFFFHLSYQPFTSLYFVIHLYNSLPFTSLPFTFYFFIAFTSPTSLPFPNRRLENMSFTVGSPYNPFR